MRAGVPADFDGLIGRLLTSDPAKRPQSAEEVAAELMAVAERYAVRRSDVRWLAQARYAIPAIALVALLGAGLSGWTRKILAPHWGVIDRQAQHDGNQGCEDAA